MISFHGQPSIKSKYLARVKRHRELDNLIQGTGWEDGRGCAVGCTLESYEHERFEIELGIPRWLAYVEDKLFEGQSKKDALEWPARFLSAIPVGVDLEKVKAPFLIFVLESTLDTFDHKKFPKVLKSIKKVIELYKAGGTQKQFETASAAYAYAAAADAAADAAAAAADAAAAAAYAAAYAAADAAAYAAYAADAAAAAANAAYAAYAADAATRKKKCKMFADKLIELFKALEPKKEETVYIWSAIGKSSSEANVEIIKELPPSSIGNG